jgi:hypothetical protein
MTTPPAPGHATNYSTFTMISDVLIDNLEPKRYLTGGVQRYPDIETGHLDTTGWFVEDVKNAYAALRAAGFRLVNARDEILEAEEWGGGPSPFYALKEDAGLRYQFFETFPFPLDPRVTGECGVTATSDHDLLGILRASHHTVLTSQPDRALKLTIDVLGGELIHEGRDNVRAVSGPYVRLADTVFHFATPDAGSSASAALAGDQPCDRYHAITWTVADLDKVARHLEAEGVRISARSATTVLTDPTTSLGVSWGFTTESIPGDDR